MTSRPTPPETHDTAAWWAATRERRLTVQRCTDCGAHQHHPRSLCTSCHGDALELVDASGRGTVLSHSTVHRSPDPAAFTAPYVVALVRLDEGPVLTTNVVDVQPEQVACDQRVEVRWIALDDGRHLPVFTPTPEEH